MARPHMILRFYITRFSKPYRKKTQYMLNCAKRYIQRYLVIVNAEFFLLFFLLFVHYADYKAIFVI